MNRLLSIDRVEDAISFSQSCIYNWVEEGRFPQPIKVGRQNRWSEQDVQRWIKDRELGLPMDPIYVKPVQLAEVS